MKVVEVVMGRSVTFHQGTCLSGSSALPSGVVLFHHDGGVNCLCVSDLMCYVLILMLVNLLSLLKRTVVSHRLLRPMGGWRCPVAASEPMVRGLPVCDWSSLPPPHKWPQWMWWTTGISGVAAKLSGPTNLDGLSMPVCFQIVFLVFLHMFVDVPHILLCILWSEDGSKSIQRSGWIQVQWQTLHIVLEVSGAFSIDLWWMCNFVHLSSLSLSCSICVAISKWCNYDTGFEGIPVLIKLNLCATLQDPGFYQNI